MSELGTQRQAKGGRLIVADTPPLRRRTAHEVAEPRLERLLHELTHGIRTLGAELRRAARQFPDHARKDSASPSAHPPELSSIQARETGEKD